MAIEDLILSSLNEIRDAINNHTKSRIQSGQNLEKSLQNVISALNSSPSDYHYHLQSNHELKQIGNSVIIKDKETK